MDIDIQKISASQLASHQNLWFYLKMVNPDFLTIEPIYPWKCTFYDCLPIASLIIQSYQSNKYFQACVGHKNLHDLRHALSDNGNILPDAKDICAINSPLDHINTL